MRLDKIQIAEFRNLKSVDLAPSSELTVITGKNGSGKSSLMEAIFYLGFGRSFRTNKHKVVINHEADNFSVFALCSDSQGKQLKLGLNRNRQDEFVCSINGERSSRLTDLVSLLPIQLFTPQSTDLILGSPAERRRFVDWGVFHVEHSFNSIFQMYSRLLKQRNAALRIADNPSAENIPYWSAQMALYGEKVNSLRDDYINALKSCFNAICSEFLPEFSLEISYYRGWENDTELLESISKKSAYDHKVGFTSVGPHKADLKFKVDGVNAQEVLSRGQLRMAVAALQLAQTKLLYETKDRQSIFLLDDVGAELDIEKRERFIDGLLSMRTQVFVTAIESEQLDFIKKYKNIKMFHVEHGHVTEE